MKKAPPRVDPHQDHAVQFYRDDAALMTTLSRFVREGLIAGQPVLVIATPEHRGQLAAQLLKDGMTPDSFEKGGTLWLLDARETLDAFMTGAAPDPGRFHKVIGDLLQTAHRGSGPVRAYGEMVDLLWKAGQADAAIRLEMLWNRLATTHHFMLLCGYCIGSFYKQAGRLDIGDVCGQHARVLPA